MNKDWMPADVLRQPMGALWRIVDAIMSADERRKKEAAKARKEAEQQKAMDVAMGRRRR